ncbi:hypothetical protein OFC55_42475, partial [Escherichia coli]|nr:hypothetical protein [Escherichia coli]
VAAPDIVLYVPATASQGALVIGHTRPGTHVSYDGRDLRVAPDGAFVFGIARDAVGMRSVTATSAGATRNAQVAVQPR